MATSTEPGTGSFPTMGTSAAVLSMACGPERGNMRPRGHSKGGSDSFMGTKANRGRSSEAMGFQGHPTATLYAQNAAEATQGQRNVVQMPSVSSWTDNWRSAAKKAQG